MFRSAPARTGFTRHESHEALELGEKAKQINPDRPYAYGVITEAQIELVNIRSRGNFAGHGEPETRYEFLCGLLHP